MNESSLPSSGLPQAELNAAVIRMIAALRKISALADELVFGAQAPITDAPLCENYQTLASLTSEIDRDWWRLFKSIDSRSPLRATPHSIPPAEYEEVRVSGARSEGAEWARANSSLVLSFPWNGEFRQHTLQGVLHKLREDEVVEEDLTIRQVSTTESVEHWREFIENYGLREAASSLIYQDARVQLRMYLNDHAPPHVHVFVPSEARRCVAKIRIDNAEFLKSELSGEIAAYVVKLVAEHMQQLSRGWERCRAGQHPIQLTAND